MADRNNVDLDTDTEQDFDQDMVDAPDMSAPSRPSLRETWDSNPLLKVGAIALGVAVLAGAYFAIFGGTQKDGAAVVLTPEQTNVSAVPGTENSDPAYVDALKELNKQDATKAAETGGSSLPVPIGTAAQSGLTVPQAPDTAQQNPLDVWRRDAESRRLAMEQQVQANEAPDESAAAPAPEVVPMVQPVRPQPQAVRMDPEAPKRLAAQMRVIIAAQAPGKATVAPITPVVSGYTLMKQQEEAQKADQAKMAALPVAADGTTPVGANGKGAEVDKVIVSAGSIVYGQLMNELNSDLPGPVLVSLLSGPFAGGRAIGKLEVRDEYLVLTFDKVIKDGVVYRAQGVALDEQTTLTGQASSIDHHWFSRVILPAAAKFITGYASAAAETATQTTTTSGGGVVQDNPKPDAKEQVYAGVEEGASQLSDILEDNQNRPITVHLNKGTTLGVLFVENITTASAMQ